MRHTRSPLATASVLAVVIPSFLLLVLQPATAVEPPGAAGLTCERGGPPAAVPFPEYLESFTDPVYRSRVTRVTGDKGAPVTNVGGTWGGRSRSIYNLKQVWSADEKLLYLHFGGPLILDGQTYEVLRRWGPPAIGTWHPVKPDVMIYVKGSAVYEWNARTNESAALLSVEGYSDFVQLSSEDFVSADGRFTAVTARRDADGKDVGFGIDLREKRKASPDLVFADQGFARDAREHQILKPSPSGKHLVMSARGGDGRLNSRGEALTVFDWGGKEVRRHWAFPHTPGHGDLALTADGHDVKVGRSDDGHPDAPHYNRTVSWGFNDGKLNVLGPSASHTSGRCFKRPGWAFGSEFGKDGVIFAVKLDGSGRAEYVCHTRHTEPVNYWAQTQAVPSPSGTRVLFTTNWGTGPNYDDDDAHSFVADFTHLLDE